MVYDAWAEGIETRSESYGRYIALLITRNLVPDSVYTRDSNTSFTKRFNFLTEMENGRMILVRRYFSFSRM